MTSREGKILSSEETVLLKEKWILHDFIEENIKIEKTQIKKNAKDLFHEIQYIAHGSIEKKTRKKCSAD